MYEKPDLNGPLANLRKNTEAWKTSLARHASEERKGKGLAWDVEVMEERDDLAAKIVDDFTRIDEVMSTHRALGTAAPASWGVDPLTDEQLAAAKEKWPHLAIFTDRTIRNYANVIGIRQVEYLAMVAVRNVPAHLAKTAK
ncbi:hypothetical protein ABZ468_07690 [Streptomyces sp. NPDC005708]|uniref:hypothetical protein n=1 Tax=Streptomyces sp. NPDC005708 TaxID=3154564 RepID=UPI0034053240